MLKWCQLILKSIVGTLELMRKSTPGIRAVVEVLTARARELGINNAVWAARAGIRKETLSRLKGRRSCDFSTLQRLAQVVGATIGVLDDGVVTGTPDGLFPAAIDRDYEDKLFDLCASRDLDPERWRRVGPAFFVAGLAVMMASVDGFDRRGLLELAERLHAGSSQVGVFALWLERAPIQPSRFLPPLADLRRAA